MENTSYNAISDEYKRSHDLPYRHAVEEYTVGILCGDLKRQDVLDLACGAGYYTRMFRRQGAGKVVGVDLSAKMIDMALDEELKDPVGADYLEYDVAGLPELGQFDIVTAIYLLNYARSAEELLNFFKAALRNLRPGGRFIGLVDNPWYPQHSADADHSKYGIKKDCPSTIKDGEYFRITFLNDDSSSFVLDLPYLSPATFGQVIGEAGFSTFTWHPLVLDPVAEKTEAAHYWDTLINQPMSIAFIGVK